MTATIITRSGDRFVGTNDCLRPQAICPRGEMPSGVGYEMCRDVCQQTAHAEVNAIAAAGAGARGATLYLEGHSFACQDCRTSCCSAGLCDIVVGAPPTC